MPEIGQVERGQDIGKLTSAWYVFAACVDCGAGRWVQYHDDRPQNQRCRKCAGIRRGQSYRESHAGRIKDAKGYVRVRTYDAFFEPMARLGYIPEHRLVMAQHLGRCLQPWEIVHHKNGIKDDNRIHNLQLVETLGNHAAQHNKGYRDGYAQGWLDGRDEQIKALREEVRLLRWQVLEDVNATLASRP